MKNTADKVNKFLDKPSLLVRVGSARLRLYRNGTITNLRNSLPKNGDATRLMKMVCTIADERMMYLSLAAKPSEGCRFDREGLVKYYEQFGFTTTFVDINKTQMFRPWKQI